MLTQLKKFTIVHFPRLTELLRWVMKTSSFSYCYHHRKDSLTVTAIYTKGEDGGDKSQLIDRLVRSYQRRTNEIPTSQWAEIFLDRHGDIHSALMGNDRAIIKDILQNPVKSDIMFGFDNMAKSLRKVNRIECAHAPKLTLDALICLAEAIGARALENPENYSWKIERANVDEVLSQIEDVLKFKIPVPNIYPSEHGILSKRGVISYRVPPAIYQAWRISQLLSGIANPKVLEIGGGLGRTAFYAHYFGIKDYTIIDIPVTSLAQGYFLGSVLGNESIQIDGESSTPDNSTSKIKLLSPHAFFSSSDHYDLIINVDSLTEIGEQPASEYWSEIQKRANIFLSINHETNSFSISQLISRSKNIATSSRTPYWMRRGYLEEIVTFK